MQMLDFNALEQPTWPITLRDAEKTVVNLTFPTVELFDRLTAMVPELEQVKQTKDGNTIRSIFNLVAELMNCNEDGFEFKAEELRDRYRMRLLDVFTFVAGYMDFIGEAQNSKN